MTDTPDEFLNLEARAACAEHGVTACNVCQGTYPGGPTQAELIALGECAVRGYLDFPAAHSWFSNWLAGRAALGAPPTGNIPDSVLHEMGELDAMRHAAVFALSQIRKLAVQGLASQGSDAEARATRKALSELEHGAGGSVPPSPSPDALRVMAAPEIPAWSWLNNPEWTQLREAYDYLATQTKAIPALSKCTPEEIAYVIYAVRILDLSLRRGASSPAPSPETP